MFLIKQKTVRGVISNSLVLNFFTFYTLQIFITPNNSGGFYRVFHHLCCFSSAQIALPISWWKSRNIWYGEDLLTGSRPLLSQAFITPY
nr:MAG TPA: hypothetical protein [Caudoviricetes sp.]